MELGLGLERVTNGWDGMGLDLGSGMINNNGPSFVGWEVGVYRC